MFELITQLHQQALDKLKKSKVIGYFCLYIPPEIIEATGFLPVRLAGLGDGKAENEGEKFIHNEACSFCKECLGLKSLKKAPYEKIDYVIIPSSCDQMKRQGERWYPEFKTPSYHFFVPATWEDPSVQEIYWQELKWLAGELGALSQHQLDSTRLKTIVDQYNQARKQIRRLNSLLGHEDAFNLAHLSFISPVSDLLKYLDQIESALEPCSPREIRLMVVGSPIGYGDRFLKDALTNYPEAQIVYDATCTGARAFEIDIPLSGDILANIATGYFTRPPCIWRRPNTQFYQYIKDLITKYQINGIIYKTLKFCDLWKFEFKRFKDWVGLPTVHIENTYSYAQSAQVNKRISIFMDMIK